MNAIFGVNGSLLLADVYIKIGLYKFNGTQKLEIPVKAQPCGVYIGTTGTNLWKTGTNTTGHSAVSRIFYSPNMASNASTLYSDVRTLTMWEIKNNTSVETLAATGGLQDTPTTGSEIFRKPTYSNGLFKIDLSGTDYYFYLASGASSKIDIVVLYPSSTQGTYYNSNIE